MLHEHELRDAAIGAVVTVVLSFTAVSPVLGGSITGYLQGESPKRGARAGAISGVVASIPMVFVLLFGFMLVLGGAATLGIPAGVELVIILFVLFPLLFIWVIGLSAVGGVAGAWLKTRNSAPPTEPPPNASSGSGTESSSESGS